MAEVTVLMSVYNGERFLRDAIDSILNQTYTDFEFVIYDDCSTDSTPDIIKSYDDSRIIYRRNESNKGLTYNLADGVNKSDAKYIARMDADDIAYPERLEKQVEWMDCHPEVTILGTPVWYFHESPGDCGTVAPQPTDDAVIKAKLFADFTLMHPTIMIRREDLARNKINYNPEFRYSQDHALYLDCIRCNLRFANTAEPLLHMRAHTASISRARHGEQQTCSKEIRNRFFKTTGLDANCTAEELDAYNAMASGEYPDTVHKVHLIENLIEKLYSNPKISNYIDRDILRGLLAYKLCWEAYHIASKKRYRKSALAARRSRFNDYIAPWPIKMKIKFIIKLLIAR